MEPDRIWRLAWWLGAVALVGVAVISPGDFVGHAHWEKVEWTPFRGRWNMRDAVANVLLFVPFGWTFPWCLATRRRRLAAAAATALVLSVSAEYFQVYSHSRIPSMTDVVTNVAGAVVGASFVPFTSWRRSLAARRRSRR